MASVSDQPGEMRVAETLASGEMAAEGDRLEVEIAAREQIEEVLQTTGATTFQVMAESMPQKIFTATPNGDVDYFNPQWSQFTGLPFAEIRDWGWTQFIHPDDVEENVRRWRQSIESGEPFEFEHRFRRADGTYRWHLSRARPVRDPAGRIVMWVGSNTDVDDLRRAHEQLARLHRLSTALSAAATIGEVAEVILEEGMAALEAQRGVVAVLSSDGSTFTNVGVVGYPEDVVAAWPGFAAGEPVPLADAVRAAEPVMLGSIDERRTRYPHLVDEHMPGDEGALVAIPLLVGGRAIGGLGLTFATPRDFTPSERVLMSTLGELCAQALERARLYEAERRARAEAEAMLGQIADGVMVIDTTGRTTYLNEAAKSLLGVDTIGVPPERRSEAYGLLNSEGMPFRPEDLPSMLAMRERRVIASVEMRIRRRDGTEIPVQENAAPIMREDGAVVGAVATLRDVSAQHELDRQKEDFLSAAAHDLKNPVTVLQGQAQLLRRRAQRGSLDQDGLLEALAVIEARSRLMTRMIDELMDVTRLRMGQELQLMPQAVNLVEVVRDAVEAAHSIAQNHTFVVQSDEHELPGFWDTTKLTRVLGNVLANAVKYSDEGSEIRIRLWREDHGEQPCAAVAIQDHGVGIPAEDLPHIFEWFYRAGNVVETVAGTGIGLAGARGIVEQHGGTIEVESQEGEGTTFTIRLPLRTGLEEPVAPVETPE